jgi:hypothetical protein
VACQTHGHVDQRARKLVTLNFASWNRIGAWLKVVDALRQVG